MSTNQPLAVAATEEEIVKEGTVSFTVESRLIRELGERLVRRSEVALVELVKNSYDADSSNCTIRILRETTKPKSKGKPAEIFEIIIEDDGSGMTFDDFERSWMTIGTSTRERQTKSGKYNRDITGEKGIGRFAVRFLGKYLSLTTIRYDDARKQKTKLEVSFDWKTFDKAEDIGDVEVPYSLSLADESVPTGTTLHVKNLRIDPKSIEWQIVRTASLGVVSPARSLLKSRAVGGGDPGFSLYTPVSKKDSSEFEADTAANILNRYALRAEIFVNKRRQRLRVYVRDAASPYLEIDRAAPKEACPVDGDIRFLPKRKGLMSGLNVDGRAAYGWIRENGGVRVYDRGFQIQPYGFADDDWLLLQADAAKNERKPRSKLGTTDLKMDRDTASSTSLNWMLRLPLSTQLIGAIAIDGTRSRETEDSLGLRAAADREGFVQNDTFDWFQDLVRGCVEAIAYVDRQIQIEEQQSEQEEASKRYRDEARKAANDIRQAKDISERRKKDLLAIVEQNQRENERRDKGLKEKEHQLEILSLLGVIGAFMTHEFGAALHEIEKAKKVIKAAAVKAPSLDQSLVEIQKSVDALESFAQYSAVYVEGSRNTSSQSYRVVPRVSRVEKILGKYIESRGGRRRQEY